MVRSLFDGTGAASRLQNLTQPLRVLYLARPGLMSKLLAIVAFFAIGIV
jgi:hypothetical protein